MFQSFPQLKAEIANNTALLPAHHNATLITPTTREQDRAYPFLHLN